MAFTDSREKQVDNFLVSKTDTRGKILYCNEEFIQISGYTEQELLGKPHSIVRHPDMPRTIFRYLWSKISMGSEVNAYVKNLAKDGSFYWVFANVSPSFSCVGNEIIAYNSVRRKPNRNGLQIIETLYTELRQHEKRGLDDAVKWFHEYFTSKNDTYENAILCLQSDTTCNVRKNK
ncbi:PAS domain S-box protein [Helicobacter aurati]|uniref:PAS domain S-box protein n=1 Tax=Helicobacter aurati TaxID=137778 RepID=A0A3D8J659_9HELI|nr:PAS domain-containing protein [Helicobacter aurati]RDU72912.1 PAS domain S-box protein [Helicobacter aurati]